MLRLQFSGEVRKPQTKTIGADQAIEFQLMRKNFGKAEPATFTWVRVTVFKPAPWQAEQLQEGRFIAGSGDFTLRSYEKDGQKRQSAEVRCQSFDIDGPRTSGSAESPGNASNGPSSVVPRAVKPADAVGGGYGGDEPPFLPVSSVLFV